jgi:7-cyano-7-deazaguanine synthase
MSSERKKAVVLLSGGMDSATCAAMAVAQEREVYPVSFYYGQLHAVEVECAERITVRLGLQPLKHVKLPVDLFVGSGSALIQGDDVEMPDKTYEELQANEGVSPTYVPYRNGTMLSLASTYALSVGASEVWYGAHNEDAAGWAYPDCTPEFIGAQAAAMYIGSYHQLRLVTPLEWTDKAGVVELGLQYGTPFEITHSCYRGERPACGTCPTCLGRLHAFAKHELLDPIDYAIPLDERPDGEGFTFVAKIWPHTAKVN